MPGLEATGTTDHMNKQLDVLLRNQFPICICLFVLTYWGRYTRGYRDNLKGVYIKMGLIRHCLYINRLQWRLAQSKRNYFQLKRLENWHVLSCEKWVKFWWAKIESWKEIEDVWIEASIWRSPWTIE